MDKPRHSSLASLLMAVLIVLQTHWAWGKDDFPIPEHYAKRGDSAGYVQAAQDYLKAHPDAEFAPRVALDLLMLSRLNDNTAIAEEMETKLLLDYLGSMQGSYFGSIYAKAEDYRARLVKLLDQNTQSPDESFAKKYHRALQFGSKKFGKDLFNDNDFLLKSAIAVAGAGDTQLEQTLLDYYQGRVKNNDELEPLAKLAMDGTKPLAERILGLHQQSEKESEAGLLRDLLLVRVDQGKNDSPALRQVRAESLLQKHKFQEALPLLEQLPLDKDGDKILFQRLWCLAVAGEQKRVAELQARLDKEFPSSPWREQAMRVSRSAQNVAKNLTLFAETVRIVVGTAKKDFDELEASLSLSQEKTGKNFTAYIAYAGGLSLFEFQLREDSDLVLAYKSTATDSTIFLKDEPTARRYSQSGPVLTPSFDITRKLDNSFNMNASFNFKQFGKNLNNSPLDSPYLNDPEKIKEMIQPSLRKGVLLDVAESPEGKTFKRIQPMVLKPEATEWRVQVSNDNRVTSIMTMREGGFNLHDIRYGPANTVKFAPPPLPDLKVVTEEKFNFPFFMKAMSKVIEIFANSK